MGFYIFSYNIKRNLWNIVPDFSQSNLLHERRDNYLARNNLQAAGRI